tara:strand:+ start:1705 stop:1875 length:171 start_codon:yes stop_codon:yes gene_type:complete
MATPEVTELMAARRHLTTVLFYLSIDTEHMNVLRLIELLDYFAENPTEYLDLINEP